MVKIFEDRFPAGCQGNQTAGYYMDGILKSNLDLAKEVVTKDWDMVFVVDGYEGVGKSVLAQQIAYYCDPTLTLDRVQFNEDGFRKQVLKAKQYQAVVFDEAYGGLASRNAMSVVNKTIVDMLTQIRQKNLFIFIVLPTFFDLDKYVALWRSRGLINVYHDRFERGFFNFYSAPTKKDLYVYGKKTYDYKCTKPDFRGRFTDFYPLDKEEYKRKKLASLTHRTNESQMTKAQLEKDILKRIVKEMNDNKDFKLTQGNIASLLNLSRKTVNTYLNEGRNRN